MGLLYLEEQAELIYDEADRLQRLKELAEDEGLALKLQEEEEKGLKRKKGGNKRACSSSRGRRIKRRAGRVTKEVIEKVVHQDAQPKEEPQEIGETEQRTRVVHPFSNRMIVHRRSLRTESEKKNPIKHAEEKTNSSKDGKGSSLKMDQDE